MAALPRLVEEPCLLHSSPLGGTLPRWKLASPTGGFRSLAPPTAAPGHCSSVQIVHPWSEHRWSSAFLGFEASTAVPSDTLPFCVAGVMSQPYAFSASALVKAP